MNNLLNLVRRAGRRPIHHGTPVQLTLKHPLLATPASRDAQSFSSKNEPFDDPSKMILQTALGLVPHSGWTDETLSKAAAQAGYSSIAHGMFFDGPIELVYYFMDQATDATVRTLREMEHSEEFSAMSIEERLKFGIQARLEQLIPVGLSNWPEGMALGAHPAHAAMTMKKLATISDEIWHWAGDRSTDMSWYTKRAIVTGIYASTELFMLTDTSDNFKETWTFLDSRITEAVQLGDIPQNMEQIAGMVGIGLQSLFSTATSLVGPMVSQTIGGLANISKQPSAMNVVQALAEKEKEVMNVPGVSNFDSSMNDLNEELQHYGGFPNAASTDEHKHSQS